MSLDLLGDIYPDRALTPLERKRLQRRAAETPRGHAWTPGTGPEGETCGSCGACEPIRLACKRVFKCAVNRAAWTQSRRTDIRKADAACKYWRAAQ